MEESILFRNRRGEALSAVGRFTDRGRRFACWLGGLCLALLWAAPAWAQGPAQVPEKEAQALPPSEALAQLFSTTFEQRMALDPSLAVGLGDRRFLGRMTVEIDPEWRQDMERLATEALASLAEINLRAVTPRQRLFAQAFAAEQHILVDLMRLPQAYLPLTPGQGFTTRFANSASGIDDLRFDHIDDHEAYLSRVEDLERWVDLAIRQMSEGATKGYVHPKSVVEAMIAELDQQLDDDPMSTVFAHAIHELPSTLSAEEKNIWHRHLKAAVEESILPAYRRLRQFLSETYAPKSRDSIGLSHLPGGKAWYATLVRAYTTTNLSPEEIFELGEKEVIRIRREMRALERFFEGRPPVTTDRWKGVSGRLAKVESTVRQNLPMLFHTIPKAPLAIREVEDFRAGRSAAAFYERAKPDNSRPGVFYIDLTNGFELQGAEALFLHEALPGHHFQTAYAQERTDLPHFLRFGYFGAYVEGWGLYAESLGKELGLYKHPDQRFGRLQFELGRAARLIADVGIHHFGWSRKKAELELSGRRLFWSYSEIDRYISVPGQALTYKIGELRLRELRRRAEGAFGSRLDIRDFHQEVLDTGPLPLNLLEAKVDRWIRQKSAEEP